MTYSPTICFIFVGALFTNSLMAESRNKGDLDRLKTLAKENALQNAFILPQQDLRSLHFSGLNLKGSNFTGADFSGTPEKRKVIENVDFSECSLDGANFSYTDIIKSKFNQASLKNANFKGARIKFTRFSGSKSQNAIFDGADLESVGFNQADIRCSSWVGTNIFRVSFMRADMRGRNTQDLKEIDCSAEHAIKDGFFDVIACPVKDD